MVAINTKVINCFEVIVLRDFLQVQRDFVIHDFYLLQWKRTQKKSFQKYKIISVLVKKKDFDGKCPHSKTHTLRNRDHALQRNVQHINCFAPAVGAKLVLQPRCKVQICVT